jgi:hypothetical protein
MATSEQLEREAEATRARIAATLDELRGRMTPGQVVDQLVDYARDSGGAEFARNFGQQVVGNPLPVTLVGAGLAWLMMAGRRKAPRGDGMASTSGVDDVAARMSEAGDGTAPEASGSLHRAHEWAQQTRATGERLNRRVGEAGSGLQDRMTAAGATVRDAASETYDAAAERTRQGAEAIGRGARTMSDNVASGGQSLLDFLQQQPLVLAGLGLAIGGLLGAALPSSETEDQLMGDASDAATSEAKSFAQEQIDKGKQVAEEAWSAAKPEIDEQLQREHDEPGDAATLVPSDQTARGDAAAEGARRDSERSS